MSKAKIDPAARRENNPQRHIDAEMAEHWTPPAERERVPEQATHDAAARERLHQRNEERP